eukprot:CAMPEP_0197035206 /NCGR_PEP_ID=MMETSP1384-20130603/13063_1 /TAXON_ID=29189 /ORGANISM="Ammonia sp." /LENGTH=343 /DNA_ID=CAMNT_0042465235 /DNA_START=16 /DNA_END=1047 /DNA_ORIENTATION=+
MIRKRVKARIEERRKQKNAKQEGSSNEPEKADPNASEPGDVGTYTNTKQEAVKADATETSVWNDDDGNNGRNSAEGLDADNGDQFNYLTDVCKDKKFNKKELSLIIKVLKLELQPLIYLLLFIKGVLLWQNTAFTLIIMLALLYLAYINVVKYLFGVSLLVVSMLMYGMKANPQNTIFALALFVGLVTPMDSEQDDDVPASNAVNSADSKEKQLKKWQLLKRAKRVKEKIQHKFMKLGEFQYLLYQLSIYIGKLRAVYFYKNETFGKIVCITYAVIGSLCVVLPLRLNFALSVLLIFSAKPLLVFMRKKKTKQEREATKKKVLSAIHSIQPDIPDIDFTDMDD